MFASARYSYAATFVCVCILSLPIISSAQAPQTYAALCASVDPADIYTQVERGIAKVHTELDSEMPSTQAIVTKKSTGSAIYRGGGEFLTNNHVVSPPDITWKNRRLFIETDDGKMYPATVLWFDPVHDLAKISIGQSLNLPILPYGSSRRLRVGNQVFSIGYQFGIKNFTQGHVSALEVKLPQKVMQIEITLNPGASGGATFACDSTIIGVNLARGPGLGFIIPIDTVRDIEIHMDKFKAASYGSLGIMYTPVRDASPDDRKRFNILDTVQMGMLVTNVKPNSAALKAGLAPGDIITRIEDTHLVESHQLSRTVLYSPPGNIVSLVILKADGKETRLYVKLDKADDKTMEAIALQLQSLDLIEHK